MFQPLRITAHLAGSIALARPEDIALDGILSYEVLRAHCGEDFYTLPNPKEVLYFARLPLAMHGEPSPTIATLATGETWWSRDTQEDTSLWYWACSRALIDVKGRDTQYWNKRFDTAPALSDYIDFGGRVEKVIIEAGRFKAYHMPLTTLVADKVVWYAFGEREALAALLRPVVAIGKKRVQGQGHVLSWEVEPIEHDNSTWQGNRLMRPLPGPLVRNITWDGPMDMQHIAFRSPQWHPMNQALCVTKGVRRHA